MLLLILCGVSSADAWVRIVEALIRAVGYGTSSVPLRDKQVTLPWRLPAWTLYSRLSTASHTGSCHLVTRLAGQWVVTDGDRREKVAEQ